MGRILHTDIPVLSYCDRCGKLFSWMMEQNHLAVECKCGSLVGAPSKEDRIRYIFEMGWAEIAVPVVILNVISNKEPQLEERYIIAWEYDCRTCCYYYNIQLPLLL